MFKKKYTPSIVNNLQIKEKVVNEINSFIYRVERGRTSTDADKEALARLCEDLKNDAET